MLVLENKVYNAGRMSWSGKCKIKHPWWSNPGHTYTMGGSNFELVTEENDLEEIFDNQLDFGKHIRCIGAIQELHDAWEWVSENVTGVTGTVT